MVKRKDKPTDLKTHDLEIYEFLTSLKYETLWAQSRTSNHKAWFRYPASLVRKFWEM